MLMRTGSWSRKSCCSTGGRHRDGNGFTFRADVPGFREKDLSTGCSSLLCITGKRQESSDQKEGTTIYSERHTKQLFRVVGPAG